MADYTVDQYRAAAKKALAAGDTAAAKRLIAAGRALEQPTGQSVPAMPMPANPVVQDNGPGPTGSGMTALYDQGILPRRFKEGPAPEQPQTVIAGDGTEMVLNPQTGQYTSRELLANNMQPGAGQAFLAGASQGVTFGAGDELAGAIGGPFLREKGRAAYDAAKRDRPGMTFAGEAGGALSVPLPMGKANTLKEAVVTGAKAGAAIGGGYAAAQGSGGALERLGDGLEGAVVGSLFGAAAPLAVNFGTKAYRAMFKATAQRPTIESLRSAKTVAYNAVDQAGETFKPAEMTALADKVKTELAQTNYVAGVDRQTDAVVDLLDRKAPETLTLGQLDKLRQNFWKRYEAAKNETGILDAIDAIDELIVSRTSTSQLLDAARLANSRYKKAELLDMAFQKAADQTSATGSGGNILNKYRQAVVSIINNPKQAKWFSADEIATMRSFVEGSTAQNVMRRIGKLAPGGNGLMLALNLGGAANFGPGSLAVTAGASAAKAISDGAAERGAQALIGKVGGGTAIPRGPITYPGRVNALAGPMAGQR